MNSLIFIDTCIVIDYINGKLKLDNDKIEKYCFNSIVDMEVLNGVKIYDAIIAATCLVYDLPLWTYNQKDFKFINGLELIKK